MSAEQLQDAIGELPEDLLGQVEALRKKKTFHWARWMALAAACLLLLIVPFAMHQRNGGRSEAARGDAVYNNQEMYPALQEAETEKIYGGLLTSAQESFRAEVLKVEAGWLLVKPLDGEQELLSADKIEVSFQKVESIPEIAVGDTVEIFYSGMLQETYPARAVDVTDIRVIK